MKQHSHRKSQAQTEDSSFTCVCVCVCARAQEEWGWGSGGVRHTVYICRSKDKFWELVPLRGFWSSNSGHQAWRPAPLPIKPPQLL
jgi:hypothetical protein